MAEWDADTVIDTERAAALIARHVPELAGTSVAPFGEGWDNAAFLVDDTWVFRFPRRAMGGRLMATEIAVLRGLPDLGVAIPRPVHVVLDPDDYPYPFAGYAKLAGAVGDSVLPGSVALAHAVGHFLGRLHSAEPPPGLPRDTLRRAALEARAKRLHACLAEAIDLAPDLPWDRARALLPEMAAAPAPRIDCLVHGDLYPRHVLIDADRATGVIDWGDVHRGDPCGDLSIAWTWFHAEARDALFAAYAVDGPQLPRQLVDKRARFRALQYAVFLLPYAAERGDAGLRAVAEHAVRETLVGSGGDSRIGA